MYVNFREGRATNCPTSDFQHNASKLIGTIVGQRVARPTIAFGLTSNNYPHNISDHSCFKDIHMPKLFDHSKKLFKQGIKSSLHFSISPLKYCDVTGVLCPVDPRCCAIVVTLPLGAGAALGILVFGGLTVISIKLGESVVLASSDGLTLLDDKINGICQYYQKPKKIDSTEFLQHSSSNQFYI